MCPRSEHLTLTHQNAEAAVIRKSGISQGGHDANSFALFESWFCVECVCALNNRFVVHADIPHLDIAVGDALLYQNAPHSEAIGPNKAGISHIV